MRYYIGVDWADEEHAVWVEDEQGQRVSVGMVPHSPVGFSEWGRELDEWRAQGIALWAAIERPEFSHQRRAPAVGALATPIPLPARPGARACAARRPSGIASTGRASTC